MFHFPKVIKHIRILVAQSLRMQPRVCVCSCVLVCVWVDGGGTAARSGSGASFMLLVLRAPQRLALEHGVGVVVVTEQIRGHEAQRWGRLRAYHCQYPTRPRACGYPTRWRTHNYQPES